VRLLSLPAKIQLGIKEGKISMGHARALLSLKDDETKEMIFSQIIRYDFSVRRVEDIVKELNNENKNEEIKNNITVPKTQLEYEQLQKHLSGALATDVVFKRNPKGNGRIIIPFKNDDDLERIIAMLDKMNSRTS
jgi:ParB family transcriptional regulator, chromosome partitioning protein